jgi:hypothetical protein
MAFPPHLEIACCNCSCLINYDCERFKLFFEGKYVVAEEFAYNDDYSCDYKSNDDVTHSQTRRREEPLIDF